MFVESVRVHRRSAFDRKSEVFSSSKLLCIAVGLYTLVVFAPGFTLDPETIPPLYMYKGMLCCGLFIAGLAVGATLFPFESAHCRQLSSALFKNGLAFVVFFQIVITAYVFIMGPTPPLLAAFSGDSAFDIALLREEAVKLNHDLVFVRIYSIGRDVFSPVVFVLSIVGLRSYRAWSIKAMAVLGILLALGIGLWSGQKATIINYGLASVVYMAASATSMVKSLCKSLPLVILAIAAVFAITLPQLFTTEFELGGSSGATNILMESVVHRVLLSPLEVSAAYVYSIDVMHIISRFDVLPFGTEFHTPGIVSAENQIALEFFYSGIESVSANALAFAYAYVLAGYFGCFVAGVLIVGAYKACVWLVKGCGSAFMMAAFSALLSYHVLDLLNSNYLAYLIGISFYAIAFWLVGSVLTRRSAGQLAPSSCEQSNLQP